MNDLRLDDIMMGREEELRQLVRNLLDGRHTLLVGSKGIGKSRLMREAEMILRGERKRIDLSPHLLGRLAGFLTRPAPVNRRILFIVHTSPLTDCLKECCEQLHKWQELRINGETVLDPDWTAVKKMLAGRGSVGLQNIVIESLHAIEPPCVIFLDSLDRVSPSHVGFLERLCTVSVVCAATVYMKEAFHFRKLWSAFHRIEIEPLSEEIAGKLIAHFLRTYNIRVIDRTLYAREILKAAGGNPFLIRNALWHGRQQRNITADEIRSLRRTEEGEYFNMGPVYIFGASFFTIFKIVSLGTDNKEFYIYFSALGFLVYLAFRVFRAFFLFRPQKYNR